MTHNQYLSTSFGTVLSNRAGLETRRVLTLGRDHGWGFSVLGRAEMPDRPIHLEKWLIVPAHEDTSPIPKRTITRIQTIYAAGIRPTGFVVVHEAPRSLPAPKQQKTISSPSPTNQTAAGTSSGLSELSGLVAAAGFAISIFALLILSGACGIDPIVVAVMGDGSWVEIDRWTVQ